LIIDKEKTDVEVIKEIYDCKTKSTIHNEICKDVEDSWRIPVKDQEKEIINIVEIEKEIAQLKEKRRRVEDELDKFIETEIKTLIKEMD